MKKTNRFVFIQRTVFILGNEEVHILDAIDEKGDAWHKRCSDSWDGKWELTTLLPCED
jgi:hypothetical protein